MAMIREGIISPFNPNQNLGEKFKPPKTPILKLPLGTLHTSLIGHFCGHHFQSCSKQRNKQVMFYSSLPFPFVFEENILI